MSCTPSLYLTTPIYYVNDIPHIGHAYTTLACDMMARFYRQNDYTVRFMTGTDEHGQKIARSALEKKISPQDFVDDVSTHFRKLFEKLDTTHTHFARTTDAQHTRAVHTLWRRIRDHGHIYLGHYEGWYAVRDEAFYPESDIVDGKAPTGAPVEYIKEPSYFFNLSQWQEPLLQFYKDNPDFIAPQSRMNEVIRFVEGGLRDLSISRTSLSWGVPVPDQDSASHDQHVIYVWMDALTIYLSSLGFPDNMDHVETFWPTSCHIMGKDILRFHAVYWPAFLMAAGLTPPKRIFAHGWWTRNGEKMSKSVGNVVDPHKVVDMYGRDAFRYFLMREVPFGQDGDFSDAAFIQRLNSDLANTYGNLVQRTLAFVHKHCDEKVPDCGELTTEDHDLLARPKALLVDMQTHMHDQALSKVIQCVWDVLNHGNIYMDAQKPWSLKKTDPIRMQTILYSLCDFIRQMAILTRSIVPDMSEKILDMLHISPNTRNFKHLTDRLIPGQPLSKPEPLVKKVEVSDVV